MSDITGVAYDQNVTLTQNAFARQYTVGYNAHGGTCSRTEDNCQYPFSGWSCSNGSSYADKATVSNLTSTDGATVTMSAVWTPASVTLPTPTWEGHTFSGWYTQETGGTKVGDGGASYTPTGNVTLHAQWAAIKYTVSGSIDHGTVTNGNQTDISHGSTSAAMEFSPSTGYKITGVSINEAAQSLSYPLESYTYPAQSSVTQNISVNVTTVAYHDVTGSIDAGGTMTGSGSQSIQSGSQNTAITFTANTGHEITSVKVNGTEQLASGAVSTYTYPAQTITESKSVVATTALKKYSVTGSIDHGGTVINGSQTVDHGSQNTAMVFTPATGYEISGITVNDVPQTVTDKTTYTFQQTITAATAVAVTTSAISYTVTYDANGNGVSGCPASQTYDITSTSALATPTRSGYGFKGWKATSASAGTWTNGTTYEAGTSLTGKRGNVTLQAQWEEGAYTATFNANGGDVTPTSSSFKVTESLALPTPTWDGRTFGGWQVTAAEGNWSTSDPVYTGASVAAGKWGNVTFTAQWSLTDYTVTYDKNGEGVSGCPDNQSYDITSTGSLASPTRNGYGFKGWKVTSALAGTWVNGATYEAGTSLTGNWGNVTLQAQWEEGAYTATFDANGGDVTPSSSSFKVTESLALPTPTREGHTFGGWKVTAAEGNWSTDDPAYTGASVAAGKWGNVTFTAQWEAIPKGDLTITVTGLKYGDNAICRVRAVSVADGLEHAGYDVTLTKENGSVTINDIYAGQYSVTLADQKMYDVSESNPQAATVTGGGTTTVTFTLTRKPDVKRYAEAYKENVLIKK